MVDVMRHQHKLERGVWHAINDDQFSVTWFCTHGGCQYTMNTLEKRKRCRTCKQRDEM
jgi:hypothetical protein